MVITRFHGELWRVRKEKTHTHTHTHARTHTHTHTHTQSLLNPFLFNSCTSSWLRLSTFPSTTSARPQHTPTIAHFTRTYTQAHTHTHTQLSALAVYINENVSLNKEENTSQCEITCRLVCVCVRGENSMFHLKSCFSLLLLPPPLSLSLSLTPFSLPLSPFIYTCQEVAIKSQSLCENFITKPFVFLKEK